MKHDKGIHRNDERERVGNGQTEPYAILSPEVWQNNQAGDQKEKLSRHGNKYGNFGSSYGLEEIADNNLTAHYGKGQSADAQTMNGDVDEILVIRKHTGNEAGGKF